MTTQARRSEGGDSERLESIAAMGEETHDSGESGALRRPPDTYAAAELSRRHERTETAIRKAHEQFS